MQENPTERPLKEVISTIPTGAAMIVTGVAMLLGGPGKLLWSVGPGLIGAGCHAYLTLHREQRIGWLGLVPICLVIAMMQVLQFIVRGAPGSELFFITSPEVATMAITAVVSRLTLTSFFSGSSTGDPRYARDAKYWIVAALSVLAVLFLGI